MSDKDWFSPSPSVFPPAIFYQMVWEQGFKTPFDCVFEKVFQPTSILPPRTPTPPHVRAVACDFDIDASTYDSGMISTVWLSRESAYYIHW